MGGGGELCAVQRSQNLLYRAQNIAPGKQVELPGKNTRTHAHFHPRWEHRVLLPGQEFLAGEIKVSLLARFFLERSQPAALGWCWHVDAPCPGSALAAAPNLKDLLQGSGFGSVRFGAVAVSGRGGCS